VNLVALVRRVLSRQCRHVAPGHHLDGLNNKLERRYAQRCTRPDGHKGAHADGHTTWKGER
jgi:hypothetical protein